MLVLGGVVGEYIFGSRLSEVSAEIQRVADKQVAELNKQAEEARLEAEQARKEASTFGREIANANARAADANKKAASAESHLAETQKRAAKAEDQAALAQAEAAKFNETAEREKLARIQLEAKLLPRSLTPQQFKDLVTKLKPYSGERVDLLVYGETAEIVNITNVIGSAARSAGWRVKAWSTISPGAAVTGILVSRRAEAPSIPVDRATDALVSALRSEGLACTRFAPFTGTAIPAAIMGPPWDIKDIAPLRIMVGAKP